MKITKKTATILSLSAAVLLVVIVAVIVIRRRGRKESEGSPMSGNASLSENIRALTGEKRELTEAAQNTVTAIWYNDFNNYYYFDKTLRYVIIPNNPDVQLDTTGKIFVEVVAVGHNVAGKIQKTVLSQKAYIAQNLLK